jgi:hypothetical protein
MIRGIMEILNDSSDLRIILELTEVPHYTTLQKAAYRVTRKGPLKKLMDESVAVAIATKTMRPKVPLSAIDSPGFESHHVSSYFVRRKEKGGDRLHSMTHAHFPKSGSDSGASSPIVSGDRQQNFRAESTAE